MAQYKFIISYENGICEDYITEKFWRPLIAGSIPIYYGSPSIQVSDSFIERKTYLNFTFAALVPE